jgi:hypothetical protein
MRINTGIKATDNFMSILNSVIGQMSDGIWENTRSMEKYWKSLDYEKSPTGEIIIIDKNYVCADPVAFFANKIKQIIQIEIDDGNNRLSWARTCSACPSYIGHYSNITVGECYQLYELLKGRNTTKHHYSKYNEYEVKLTYGTVEFSFHVNALSEREAKEQAKRILVERFTAEATRL